jgi:hypothetical protein
MRSFVLLLLLVLPASAHQPGEVDHDITIDRPQISWSLEGELDEPDGVVTISMDMPTDFALPFEILVPHRSPQKDFRPAYVVVAGGLPAPTEEEKAMLPKEVPEGMGVYVDLNDDPERTVVFEDVLRRVYWSSTTVALPVRAGPVEVWIWSPTGQEGPFTFAFGVEEDFGGGK